MPKNLFRIECKISCNTKDVLCNSLIFIGLDEGKGRVFTSVSHL